MDSTVSLCVILPTHNHVRALPDILAALSGLSLPVIVVDDGSAPDTGHDIARVCASFADVEYTRHSFNGGKGFAVLCGLARAAERGFTHALQIDADGQHDLTSVPAMIAACTDNPQAVIVGAPVFDHSAPFGRRLGRQFTAFWVAVNTLSLSMPDTMCGFRVYPVASTLSVVRGLKVRGRRMDFDIEILVKLRWAGVPFVPCPVRVTYPPGNSSNFQMLDDNVLLTAMQTRLFFGMVRRLPARLGRGLANLLPGERRTSDDTAPHWSDIRERGTYAGMLLLARVYGLLGRRVCMALLSPVVLFFWLTGRTARQASADYLLQAWRQGYLPARPGPGAGFRHFLSFAEAAVDKFAAWTGRIGPDDVTGIHDTSFRDAEQAGGAFVLTAHLGNPEVLRGVAGTTGRWRVNVLVHTIHAVMFNSLIERFSKRSTMKMTQVTDVGPDTAIALSAAVERGEWVVMVADRVPVGEGGRTVQVPFMGRMASFPQGPFILASILKCPTYVMFCTKRGDGFDVHMELLADPLRLPRGRREQAIAGYAATFSQMLERQVAKTPLQWFNFYPFWNAGGQDGQAEQGGSTGPDGDRPQREDQVS